MNILISRPEFLCNYGIDETADGFTQLNRQIFSPYEEQKAKILVDSQKVQAVNFPDLVCLSPANDLQSNPAKSYDENAKILPHFLGYLLE